MLVEMRMSVAGARYSLAPGDVAEFSDAEAQALIDKGYAVEVVPESDPEPEKKSNKK